MCRGTIGSPWSSHKAFPTGALYLMMSVEAFGAVARTTWFTADPCTAVAPPTYLTVVLIVHAASSAVIARPSDHFPFGRSLNVQDLPSFDAFQDFAQSPTTKYPSFGE